MILLVQFDTGLIGKDGRRYIARVCGRETEDNLWEGWLEFDPRDGTHVLRTPRETTQPNLKDLEYWATGLTHAYLEGALDRALHPETPDLRPRTVAARPAYQRPARSQPEVERAAISTAVPPHAVLNPFEVYRQGEDVLRVQLAALDEGHLRNVVRAHALVGDEEMDLLAMHRSSLVEMIIAAVRRRVG